MTQGAENDLLDVRFYQESTPVIYYRSNEPFEDININVLTVDNKAIAARDTALTVQTDLGNHIGQGGVSEHAVSTTGIAGFMSSSNKAKLDRIQEQAQLNTLAPVDALSLISRGITTIHAHPPATTTIPGFLTSVDKGKLNSIAPGAQVNNISTANVTTLTTGGNADSLHGHSFAPGTESFTSAVHAVTNHTGLPGIPVFPGFASSSFNVSLNQVNSGVTIFSINYTGLFTTTDVVSAGFQKIQDNGWFGLNEAFSINSITLISGIGTVIFEIHAGMGFGDMEMTCWQVGYGVV